LLIRLLIAGRTVNVGEKDGVPSIPINMATIGDRANKNGGKKQISAA